MMLPSSRKKLRQTVFDPEYEQYINVSGYDRIKRYYFNEDDNLDQV